MSSVAVITPAHGRHRHLKRQQESLSASAVRPSRHVLVAMDDPVVAAWPGAPGVSTHTVSVPTGPSGLPLAAARNVGAATALDLGAEVLVFLDVDCLAGGDLVASYAEAVCERPDVIWSGPVTYLPPSPPDGHALADLSALDDPHPARPAPAAGERWLGASPDLFWSLSFAVHATTWRRLGGFCEEYVGYGGEDTDFAHVAAAARVELAWDGGARAYHQHHETASPPVQHLGDIVRNGRIFHSRWGRWPMRGWLVEFERMGLVTRVEDQWVVTRGARERLA